MLTAALIPLSEYHTLAGYVLNKEPITIEHTTNGNVDLVVDNTVQKKFEVVKVDSQTKQPLAGVQFQDLARCDPAR